MKSTPTAALELTLGVVPLDLFSNGYAAKTCYRLKNYGCTEVVKDSDLDCKLELMSPKSLLPVDCLVRKYVYEKKYSVYIGEREKVI